MLKIQYVVQSLNNLKQAMYLCISTKRNYLTKYGVREQKNGDKFLIEEFLGIGWSKLVTEKPC